MISGRVHYPIRVSIKIKTKKLSTPFALTRRRKKVYLAICLKLKLF